jgi:hypothetical protein
MRLAALALAVLLLSWLGCTLGAPLAAVYLRRRR